MTALPVPSRYKSCSSHVSTAHFRLRRFLDHFCSLVQPFTRSTVLIMTRNKAAIVTRVPGDVAGNRNELYLPANPKQRALPKCSKCRNQGHRGRCKTLSLQFPLRGMLFFIANNCKQGTVPSPGMGKLRAKCSRCGNAGHQGRAY